MSLKGPSSSYQLAFQQLWNVRRILCCLSSEVEASVGGIVHLVRRYRAAATPRSSSSSPDPEIPNSRSPDSRFGRETGRELPIPDRPGIGNREIPRFPIRPGHGNRGPDWPQIGKSGIPRSVSTAGTILGWLLP
jgi:hypothetical protein